MPLLPALANRRASRAFSAQPVPTEAQELLWQAVSVAPSRGNSQPTRLLVARSAAVRKTLEGSLSEGNRTWALAAPLFVAVAVNPAHDGVETNSDGTEREMWGYHAGIATGNLMAQATALGLIAHPISKFDEVAARAAFGAPAEVRLMAIMAVGYPGSPDSLPADLQEREKMPQDRLPLANLVAEDRWSSAQSVSARDLQPRRHS
jgi:nitroreductase